MLISQNVYSPVSGMVWEGLEGVALLNKIYQWKQALKFQKLEPGPVFLAFFLLPADKDVKLSAGTPCFSDPYHDDNGLIL